ncbi:MAG: FadR/GntR family transcriptional regulator [Hyphomicrobiaceae bacterium]
MNNGSDENVLSALRDYISHRNFALNERLPVERIMAERLGVTRARLRKALAILEAEGMIWRHVGRGTFVGPRFVLNLADVNYLTEHTSPREVMEARMAIEPQIARLASIHGNDSGFKEISRCHRFCSGSIDWRGYEMWDMNLHRAIAQATQNKLLLNLFETLNLVRRATVWEQARATQGPASDYISFREHDVIVQSIVRRDADAAAAAMHSHLSTVRDRLQRIMDP